MTPPRKIDPWAYWYRRVLPAYWIALACVTHFPKLSIPGRVPQSDKLAHFSAFALLAFLYWRFAEAVGRKSGPKLHGEMTSARHGEKAAATVARCGSRKPGRAFVWVALAVMAAYAALDEYTQPWFGRDCDITDWLMDMAGASVALAMLEWRRRAAGK